MRLLAPVLAVTASLLLTGCIPPEPDDDLIVQYDPEETVMGEIQQRDVLNVAIPAAEPFKGFTRGLAELIADALDVQMRATPTAPSAMLEAPEKGSVDISFPLITVTEKLVRHYAFTDPFYIAHQRLLVEQGSGFQDVDDLSGVVCQYFDEQTGVDIRQLNTEVRPISPPDWPVCVADLSKGRVQAISAADWLLLPILVDSGDLDVVGDDLTTEAYGAVVESEASAWSDFVNGVLAEADVEGDWQRLYEASFGPYVDEAVTYPNLTIEEAAALFPSDL